MTKFHMENFILCEKLHVIFHMWKVLYDLFVQFYMSLISCENLRVKFHMRIFTSGISYVERNHM